MMRGWAAPGKTSFQAAAEAEQATQAAEDGGAAAAESAATQQPAPDPGSAGADAATVASASTNQSPSSSSPDGSTIAVSDIPPTQTTASDGSTSATDETSQKIQDMVRMFEQRREIQEQQNQAAAKPHSSN